MPATRGGPSVRGQLRGPRGPALPVRTEVHPRAAAAGRLPYVSSGRSARVQGRPHPPVPGLRRACDPPRERCPAAARVCPPRPADAAPASSADPLAASPTPRGQAQVCRPGHQKRGAGRSPGPLRGPVWLTQGKLRPAPAGPGRDLEPESRGLQHLTLMTAPFLLDTEVNPFHPQSHHNATGFTILFKPSARSSWLHPMQGKNQKWFTLRDQRSRVWLWSERNQRRPFTLGTSRSQCPGTANAPHSSQKGGAWSPGSPRMEM